MDLAARVSEVVAIDQSADAIYDRGMWTSWGRVQEFIRYADALLDQLGAGRDAEIAVVLRNRAAAVALVWAILATRRCLVTISPMQSDEPLAEELRALRVPIVIAYQDDWDRPGIPDAARLAGTMAVAIADAPPSLAVLGDPAAGPARTAAGVAVKMLTSGTTGAPRRVEISYRELEQGFESAGVYRRATDDDKLKLRSGATIVALPLSHMSGLWLAIEAAVEGRKVAVLEKFQPREWAQLVREHRPGFANLPPTPIRMVLDAGIPKEWLSSLRAIRAGNAPLDPNLADEFYRTYGVPVLTIYGATELGSLAGLSLDEWKANWEQKRGTVGRALPGVTLRIVDESSGRELGPGEVGVLEVRLDRNPAGADVWTRTNDLARLDSDGYLFVEGRVDTAIIRGGFKVLPKEVEAVLDAHPALAEASVLGVADARLGQVPVAALELKPEVSPPSEDELRQWCAARLRPYQVPVRFHVFASLPRNRATKVDRRALEAMVAERESASPGC